MANVKITDLTAYADPVSTDVLPIVDVGADVTKKVSIADLLENAGSGTESLPGIAFDGDPDTGIYRPSADQLAISTNGSERAKFGTSEVVFNGGGANYDFRIEGDSETNLFFVDASTNRVAMGTASPRGTLEIFAPSQTGVPTILLSRSPSVGTTSDIALTSNSAIRGEFSINNVVNTNGVFTWNIGGTDNKAGLGGSSEVMRIDSFGRLLMGATIARANIDYAFGSSSSQLQVEQAGLTPNFCIVQNFDNATTAAPAILTLARSGSSAIGSNVIVASGNRVGEINFSGSDGSNFTVAASIRGEVDGTPGANDMPGRLVFSVTADGASSPTEAMRIKNTRVINFSNAPVYADNAAAKTGGLVDGDVYRTSTGDLKIVYT